MVKTLERHHREKERKRRKRRDSYDDYEDEGGISGWKLGLVIGVIVVCFAMLYPTLFHPMLMGFFGRGQPAPSISQQRPPVHPAMGGGGPRHPGGHPSRPDVHPAMRMAQAQAESQSGGSKGMFTWMLPIYTIGVVLFLLYTLFKTRSKNKKRRRPAYLDSDEDDSESERETKYGGKFGKKKLRGLQERLRQTEDAMAKILEQLESVQAGANPMDLDAAEEMAEKLEEDVAAKQAVGLTETNEQYIKDLETALKEFQTLSAAYDSEKKKKKTRSRVSSSEDEDEDDEEEGSSEMSEIEEEEEEEEDDEVQAPPPPPPQKKQPQQQKQQQKKKKNKQKNTSEEEDEKEEEEKLKAKEEEGSEAEEEGIDIDSELREQEEKAKKEQKTVRRRRAKKT